MEEEFSSSSESESVSELVDDAAEEEGAGGA